jgi:4-hydroxy-tetrahydrodipicolinate synthase
VDALLSVSPYYNKPSQEGIVRHFQAVADASPVPVLLYNIPGRTASNLTAETTLRLANYPNIIGTKEASGNLEQCMRIARDKPKDFMLLSGDDMLTVSLYSMGGKGVISVLANAYPVIFRKLRTYADSGSMVKASQELSRLLDINGPMYDEGNPVGVKYLLSTMGICEPHVRLPMVEASKGLKARIDKISLEAGK